MPGDRGPCFLHAARERGPLGELTGLQVAALGAAPVRSPPRSPAMPVAGPLKSGCTEVLAAARPPRQSLRSVARRPQRRRCSWMFGRLRCNRCARRAGTSAATLRRPWEGAARAPVVPPRSPHGAPVKSEGDLWGDLQAVGRETGSLLRLRGTPPIPNPFP